MRSWCLAALVGLCALPAWAISPEPGPAHLVADLSPGLAPLGTSPFSAFRAYTPLAGRVLFLSFFLDGDDQCGLWSTDGTAAGTGRLADLCAESLSPADDAYRVQSLGVAGPIAFLTDSLGRLWRTDGTAAGAGTYSLGITVSTSLAQPVVGPHGILYFATCGPDGYCQPWRSDGTLAGTRQLLQIEDDPDFLVPFRFVIQGDRVLFSGGDVRGPVVWVTDGTADGTRELARLPDPIGYLLPVDGGVYVSTNTGSFSSDLWLIPADGTAVVRIGNFGLDFRQPGVFLFKAGGRVLFEDFEEDGIVSLWEIPALRRVRLLARFNSGMGPISEMGGRLIFAAAADSSAGRFSLWVLGPKMSRPRPVHGCPGGCPSVEPLRSGLGVLGGRAVFAGLDHRGSELWETDGTGAGTKLLRDLCPGKCGSLPRGFSLVLGRLIFTAGDRELWSTDGTAAGTVRLGPILPGLQNGLDFAGLGGRVVFSGFDSLAGDQPWVSDLTVPGTHRIGRLGGSPAAESSIQDLTPLGSGVVFSACTPAGPALWGSDGTTAGTQRLVAAGESCSSFFDGPIVTAGGTAFFSLDAAHLWRTDGTPGGTQVLASWSDATVDGLLPLSGGLFFTTTTASPQPPFAVGFWRSDGTLQGTRQTGSVPLGGSPEVVGASGSDVFFAALSGDPPFDVFLWRTDGTAAGTRTLARLGPADFGLSVVRLEGRTLLVMAGAGRSAGLELWTTDGTAAGTVPVIADPNAPRPLAPRRLAVLQGAAYFFAGTGEAGDPLSLWRSDGTEAGTARLMDFASDPDAAFLPGLTLAGGLLFFPADDGVHGMELWRTDGTAAGTVLVRDIAPGPAQSRLESLTAVGGRLYFSATDGEHGRELWTSDGTAAGTVMVQDILPGPVSSWPQNLGAADGNLFFTADDGVHGRELWVLPLEPQP
jgi:ELWxxDGT repeat protein